jgi:hypothetical protein
MKTFEDHRGTSPQPINECGQGRPEPFLAHSKGGPDVNPLKNRISVRFATLLPLEIEIKLRRPAVSRPLTDPLTLPMAAWVEEINIL